MYFSTTDQGRSPAPLPNHWFCPTCRYDLHGVVGGPYRCPECGRAATFRALAAFNSPTSHDPRFAYAVAALTAFAIWAAFSAVSRGAAAWLSAAYWLVEVPALLVASTLLGFIWPHRPWRWPCALIGAHALGLLVRIPPSDLAWFILPDVLLAVVLSLVAIPAAYFGAALRHVRD